MIPPPVQTDFVGFARKLRRIFLPTIVFVGVTLAPDSAYSQFVLIGTTPGGVDILSPEADPATGWRRVATLGNLGENLSATFHLPPGHYY